MRSGLFLGLCVAAALPVCAASCNAITGADDIELEAGGASGQGAQAASLPGGSAPSGGGGFGGTGVGAGGTSTGGTGGIGTGGAGTGGAGTGVGTGGTGGTGGTCAPGGAGGTIAGHTCSVTNDQGTGNEPACTIPICCTPLPSEQTEIDEVFNLLNAYRAANGRNALTYDTDLEAAIQGHCIHMVLHPFWGHGAPEASVSHFATRAGLCGTSAHSENLAGGQPTPAAVMSSWQNSSGHNTNMLNPNSTRVGICRYGSYWGQIFGP